MSGKTSATTTEQAALRRRCRAALYEHRRRARADRQVVRYGLRDLEDLARDNPTCAYCGCLLSAATLSFDHATPTSRAADYTLGNLAVCCGRCNEAKGLLTAEEFRQLLVLLRTWHPRAGADVLGRLRAGGRRYAVSRRRGESRP
jgi:5-methylcytosine-specific restriction endonuclease McrA